MGSISDFENLQSAITESLVATTRSATRLAAEDVPFLRSSDLSVAKALDDKSARLLALAEKLIQRSSDAPAPRRTRLSDADEVNANWRSVVDSIDSLLERADTALDEFKGYFKSKAQDGRTDASTIGPHSRALHLFRNQDLPKPQLAFEHRPSNHEKHPFVPLLSSKPHAKYPLDNSTHGTDVQALHPYQREIEEYEYPSRVYHQTKPIPPLPFESTQATFVDDMEGVRAMLNELEQAQEIAVDLEHHDQHSYIGLVSLMQISTREKDWVVDTLQPWRQQLECLNKVFADPGVVKVLHGSAMDIIWLQRDLGLYVVGLFDTYHASCVLEYPGHGLAYLLKRFVDFDAQKQYQMADWRIRPLPRELFDYARSDTHFLLYVYDCLRNELIQESNAECDKIESVLKRSKSETLQRYEHPFYVDLATKSANGWYNFLWKGSTSMSDESIAVFRRLHRWRDDVAREEDESPQYLMPVHVLFTISRNLPRDKAALLTSSHPLCPPLRLRIDELLRVVQEAIAHPEEGARVKAGLIESRNKYFAAQASESPRHVQSDRASVQPVKVDARAVRTTDSVFWGGTVEMNGVHRYIDSALPASFMCMPGMAGLDRVSGLANTPPLIEPTLPGADGSTPASNPRPKKRKAKEQSTDGAEGTDSSDTRMHRPPATNHVTAEKIQALKEAAVEKVRAKAAKKANKALKKTAREEAVEVVDYDQAPKLESASMSQSIGEAKKAKKVFNPFTKGSEGDAGLGRSQQIRNGKSATFKR